VVAPWSSRAGGRISQVPPYASLPNPKSEARNPKEIRSPKSEWLLASGAAYSLFHAFLRTSDFGPLSGFGPRVSVFWGDGAGGTDRMRPGPPARFLWSRPPKGASIPAVNNGRRRLSITIRNK